ncbi:MULTISPECIES: hypothetical protein [unclassified Streptomyces]|uniref:hypothetical protein n=1 Tax=unclassified Streptomyces TaxID=2593676 RepID=UPI003076A3BA
MSLSSACAPVCPAPCAVGRRARWGGADRYRLRAGASGADVVLCTHSGLPWQRRVGDTLAATSACSASPPTTAVGGAAAWEPAQEAVEEMATAPAATTDAAEEEPVRLWVGNARLLKVGQERRMEREILRRAATCSRSFTREVK